MLARNHPLWQADRVSIAVKIVAVILGALLFTIPSFWNGMPFLFHDSGFYLLHATMEVSEGSMVWRSLAYSYLMKLGLIDGSLTGFIFLQNLLVSGVLYGVSFLALPGIRPWHFLVLVSSLYLTILPWISNFLMPDVWAGLMILAVAGAYLSLRRGVCWSWIAVAVFTSVVHYSNVLLLSLMSLSGLFLTPVRKKFGKTILVCALLPWLALPTLHWLKTGAFVTSSTSHLFLYSRFVTLGVADDFLDEKCLEHLYAMCMLTQNGFEMWKWGEGSMVAELGGLENINEDIKRFNRDFIFSPYVFRFLRKGFKDIGRQALGVGSPMMPTLNDEYLRRELAIYSPDLAEEYDRQSITPEHVDFILPPIFKGIELISILSLAFIAWLLLKKKLSRPLRTILYCTLIAYGLNAVVCGLLSSIEPRYSTRFLWIYFWLCGLYVLDTRVLRQKPV